MTYDRKIKYLDYLEKGERLRGVGFVKLERREDICNLNMQVQNLHRTDSFIRKVYLIGEKEEALLGEVSFKEGRGALSMERIDSRNLCGSGISYDRLRALRIPIGKDREILCRIQDAAWPLWSLAEQPEDIREKPESQQEKEESQMEKPESHQEQEGSLTEEPERYQEQPESPTEEPESHQEQEGSLPEKPESHQEPEESQTEKPESHQEKEGSQTEKPESHQEQEGSLPEKSESHQEQEESLTEKPESHQEKEESQTENLTEQPANHQEQPESPTEEPKPEERADFPIQGASVPFREQMTHSELLLDDILDNKWNQLWAIYPHVRPFEDEREYLSVTPSDFVVLQDRSYRLVNNSFLLHGYYHYDHLILGRWEKRGDVRYYIGVPGSFYEKERQVAVMFGFESFECKEEPAHLGDYGYYMIRVDL